MADAPNLAGQNERYLAEQLGAFKAGVRQNEMMSIAIKDLSPTDIEDLAAYYAAIEITVGKIPGELFAPAPRDKTSAENRPR